MDDYNKYLKHSPENLWNDKYTDKKLSKLSEDQEFWKTIISSNYSLPDKKPKSYKNYFLNLNKLTHKYIRITVDKKKKADILLLCDSKPSVIVELALSILNKLEENVDGFFLPIYLILIMLILHNTSLFVT